MLYPTLNSVSTNTNAIRRLQQRLIDLGFLDGRADGDYGAKTYDAVLACQKHMATQGYEVKTDGEAEAVMQSILFGEDYSSYIQDVHPSDENSEVRRIERRLRQLGYMDAAADSSFDEYAVECLKVFQTDAGFDADGIADRAVIDALFSADAPRAAWCAPHDISTGDSGLAVRQLQQALVSGGLTNRLPDGKYGKDVEEALAKLYKYLDAVGDVDADLFSDPKAVTAEAQEALQRGLLGYRTANADNKSEVTRIQNRLYTLCYLPKSGIDGLFGRNSEKAVAEFQSANGLFATGEIDEATQSILFSAAAKPKPYPYRVEVSIARQVVEVYELQEDGDYALTQSFTCSTGLHDATPRGIFLEGHPVNRWHHFEKFNCWAQYSYIITGDIMFHSVLYSSDNEKSLRSGSLYALGNPASHGCVRLTVEDARWLYEHCKRGKTVIVIS